MKTRLAIYLVISGLLILSGCGKKSNRAATRVATTGVTPNNTVNPNQLTLQQQQLLLQQQQQNGQLPFNQQQGINPFNQQTGLYESCEAYGYITHFSGQCCDPLQYNCYL